MENVKLPKKGKKGKKGKEEKPKRHEQQAKTFRYSKHWSKEKGDDELKKGNVFQAIIRYNASDKTQAFCAVEGLPSDVFVGDLQRQNRSIHGDLVLIRILPHHKWYNMGIIGANSKTIPNLEDSPEDVSGNLSPECDSFSMMSLVKDTLDPSNTSKSSRHNNVYCSLKETKRLLETNKKGWRATGEVVRIIKESERRSSLVGCIQQHKTGPVFVPLDKRLPVAEIIESSHIYHDETDRNSPKANHYFEARLVSWEEKDKIPKVQLKCILGKPGKLETDIQAILLSERIQDDCLFDENILKCLPETPWQIPSEEYTARRDMRGTRIFSIDPETAKDLDDALSIEKLDSDLFRVGVHIADVSYFVEPGSALDKAAQERSTSVYLVDRVIPMLPRLLCEQLCSLNPGSDRLALSIIWDMNSNGEFSNIWFGRTIIHSCAKLSYKQAQSIIDGYEKSGQILGKFDLQVHNNHSQEDISRDVISLNNLAQELRKKRFLNGSLRLDNAKVAIALDDGEPLDFSLYETGSANHLVEEFMLAANIKAATIISEAYPNNALLRMHPEPNMEKLINTSALFSNWLPNAPKIVTNSSGDVQKSLKEIEHFCMDNPEIVQIMTFLCTKPMQMAQYFNTGDVENKELWRHYALSIPRYTHFTSPIRRYPDIIVHRLMMAALNKTKKPSLGSKAISMVAEHANERKAAAKSIQDRVIQLYLVKLLEQTPRVLWGVVSSLGGPKFFDVYIPDIGVDIRMYAEDIYMKGFDIKTEWNPKKKYVAFYI